MRKPCSRGILGFVEAGLLQIMNQNPFGWIAPYAFGHAVFVHSARKDEFLWFFQVGRCTCVLPHWKHLSKGSTWLSKLRCRSWDFFVQRKVATKHFWMPIEALWISKDWDSRISCDIFQPATNLWWKTTALKQLLHNPWPVSCNVAEEDSHDDNPPFHWGIWPCRVEVWQECGKPGYPGCGCQSKFRPVELWRGWFPNEFFLKWCQFLTFQFLNWRLSSLTYQIASPRGIPRSYGQHILLPLMPRTFFAMKRGTTWVPGFFTFRVRWVSWWNLTLKFGSSAGTWKPPRLEGWLPQSCL